MQQDKRFAVTTADASEIADFSALSEVLRKVREALRMDVVFVSEFANGRRAFRCVDSAPGELDVRVGASDPLEESFCQRVVDGRLPSVIHDAMTFSATRELPATAAVRVGAHLSVPIVLRNGQVFGTLCCFSHHAQPELAEQDAEALSAVADMVAAGIDKRGLLRSSLWPDSRSSQTGEAGPASHHA